MMQTAEELSSLLQNGHWGHREALQTSQPSKQIEDEACTMPDENAISMLAG